MRTKHLYQYIKELTEDHKLLWEDPQLVWDSHITYKDNDWGFSDEADRGIEWFKYGKALKFEIKEDGVFASRSYIDESVEVGNPIKTETSKIEDERDYTYMWAWYIGDLTNYPTQTDNE